MNEFENYAENYYPKDITSTGEKEISNDNNRFQTAKTQSFSNGLSMESLFKLLSGKDTALLSSLLSKNLANSNSLKDPSTLLKSLSELTSKKTHAKSEKSHETTKKIEDDFYEEL